MRQSFLFHLTCILFLGLVLISCARSDGTTSSTDSMTLHFVQNSSAPAYFPIYVAEQEGYFKAQGVTLSPYPPPQLGTGPKVTAAMESASSNVDLAASTITDAITESRVNANIRIVGLLSTDLDADSIVSKSFVQQTHLTEASPTSAIIKALVRKKIGITSFNSATNAYITYLFRQENLNVEKDATLISIGGNNAIAALGALKTGRVDALAFPIPSGQQAEVQGIGTMLIRSDSGRNDVKDLAGTVTGVLYTKQSTIDSKPKAIQAFIRAIAQAEDYIHKNPATSLVLLAKYLKQPQKTVDTIIAPAIMSGFPIDPRVNQENYDAAMRFHTQGGLLAVALAYKDIVDEGTINQALK